MSKYPAHYDSYLRAHFQGIGAASAGSGVGINDPQSLFGLPLDPNISGSLPDGYVLTWSASQGYWTAKASTSVSPANPTATASNVAVNGTATTYMRSDAAPAIQLGSSSQKGIVQVDNTTITASSGVISASASGLGVPSAANPTATAADTAVNGSASTFMRSDAAPKVQKASDTVYGLIKYDNSSITLNGSNQIQASPGSTIGSPIRPPGYVTGRLYFGPNIMDTSTTGSRATGTIWACPFCCTSAHTFTGIGISTSASGSVNAEFGIYADSGGQPGALIQDCGQVSLNTGTTHTLTVNIPLTPGWYWLAISVSATITLDVTTGPAMAFYQGAPNPSNAGYGTNIPTVAWVYNTGNLPNPFGTVVYSTIGAPQIYLIA